ncbi:hypothetical protein B1806_00690 [Metallibacterium scheffleri]|uniref:Uncharacterized protein n=1 Tax=Metallibacterium scheffleri TaxID=993689 RepID=A0A4S3KUF3_9GAMM|nr:hypothetical protein B1806_00690 [Metallibacterium scheffleri]
MGCGDRVPQEARLSLAVNIPGPGVARVIRTVGCVFPVGHDPARAMRAAHAGSVAPEATSKRLTGY